MSSAKQQNTRVTREMRDGKPVWVKYAAKDYRNGLQRLLLGGRKCQLELKREAAILRTLAERDILVPPVLEQHEDRIVIGDLGTTLEQLLRNAGPQTAQPLIRKAAVTLETVHRAGSWHGNAVLRNLTLAPDGRIGLFDFDHGVPHWLPLRFKQGYDLWLLASSSLVFDPSGELALLVFQTYDYPPVKQYIRGLQWLLKPVSWLLAPFRNQVGRDIQRALQLLSILQLAGEFVASAGGI